MSTSRVLKKAFITYTRLQVTSTPRLQSLGSEATLGRTLRYCAVRDDAWSDDEAGVNVKPLQVGRDVMSGGRKAIWQPRGSIAALGWPGIVAVSCLSSTERGLTQDALHGHTQGIDGYSSPP